MKKRILTYITALVILPFLHSCDETDEMRQPEPFDSWQNGATLKFAPKADATGETQVSFEYKIDKKNPSNNGWSRTELNYDLSFASEGGNISEISKIELYAFLEEKLGDNYNYIGGETGKLLTTITQPTASSLFKITTDQLSELFKNDFSGNRTELSEEDFVEIKWVITGKDGKVLDSRKDCFGFDCSYGVKTSIKYVDTWLGEFEATWTEVGPGTISYSYTKVTVGAQRTIKLTPGTVEGKYIVDDMAFGGAFGGPRGGALTYDAATKTLTMLEVETYYDSIWEVVSVTDSVLTIKWTNKFTTRYSEFGTVELRRNDGLKWPSGLKIVK